MSNGFRIYVLILHQQNWLQNALNFKKLLRHVTKLKLSYATAIYCWHQSIASGNLAHRKCTSAKQRRCIRLV